MMEVLAAFWTILLAIAQLLFGAFCILRAIADSAAPGAYPTFAAAIGVLCIATAITLILGVREMLGGWRLA